jgi:hypothetical protein
MAFRQQNITVGTSAVPIAVGVFGPATTQFTICNNHGSDIHIGGSSVSTSAASGNIGVRMASNATLQVLLRGGDTLWAVTGSAATNPTVTVLWSD